MSEATRVIIMGAAGRDFHNFNTHFRGNGAERVVAFTAYQIPGIAGRTYPAELAGPRYPEGIPIYDESELPRLIRDLAADEVVFAYSDVAHEEVMHRAALVNSCGADFRLLGNRHSQIKSTKPLLSVGAIRTGCGKSQTSRRIAQLLHDRGKNVVVIRHPMPYGDLLAQRCQRFATLEDLDLHECTIEEREEYEEHIQMGHTVYAGVDYEAIIRSAEKEADVILWDGGNNDTPFYESGLHIVLVDPLRPGHEVRYHPGETNLRMADVILVSKISSATSEDIAAVKATAAALNPGAQIIESDSVISANHSAQIRGKRVLVVEDGPTLTHGEMSYGAGHVAARKFGASEIVDPRPYAVGSIRDTFAKYPHVSEVLPAMGYGDTQVEELRQSINAVPCDLVLVGTPFDLGRLIKCDKPLVRVRYEMDQQGTEALSKLLDRFLAEK
ncbi:MAG: GTPase [Acidobacteriota bacterium]|nr:MAG: GTPase [Acidobacteriota bacterium]